MGRAAAASGAAYLPADLQLHVRHGRPSCTPFLAGSIAASVPGMRPAQLAAVDWLACVSGCRAHIQSVSCLIMLPWLQGCVGLAEWGTAGVFNLLGGCAGLPGVHVHMLLGPRQHSPALDDSRCVQSGWTVRQCVKISCHKHSTAAGLLDCCCLHMQHAVVSRAAAKHIPDTNTDTHAQHAAFKLGCQSASPCFVFVQSASACLTWQTWRLAWASESSLWWSCCAW